MFKKTWDVYYWYRDALGCQQIIAKAVYKGRRTSGYIQGQGLSKSDLRKIDSIFERYNVNYGFVLREPETWLMKIIAS